jgi:hypothetical protein
VKVGSVNVFRDWVNVKWQWMVLQEGRRREAIDIWKSKYSNLFYGCSERGRNFPRMFKISF